MDNALSVLHIPEAFHFKHLKMKRFGYNSIRIIFFLLCISLISSCTRVSLSDGPPNFYVDENKIPNAKPKVEPLAKYGNKPFYSVFGKRYYVMKSFRNYDEVGTASWYGTKFHARLTSSGEPYNMLAMTAAHKNLPLPTYVEVTNLDNRKKVIVKVNDRGPFLSNRIIDLSYVAAKKLGMLGRGTAHVRVKAINPYTFGSPGRHFFFARNTHTKSNHAIVKDAITRQTQIVYLQVGAFRDKANAVKFKARLIALLATPIIISHVSGSFYRVQVGPIKDLITAKKLTHRLAVLGIKSNKISGV